MSTEEPRPTPARPVTRVDVAKLAGVSPSVVSYVLNPSMRPVAAETRRRVLEAMETLSYRPNAMARALKTRKTRTLGLVVPDLSNPFFAELSRRIEDAARQHDYSLLLTNSYDSPSIEQRQLETLLDRQVDGLVLVSPTTKIDLEPVLVAGLGTVLLDRVTAHERCHTIGVDYRAGARGAVEHLLGHGHRRIGLVTGAVNAPSVMERRTGWEEALSAAGLPLGPVAIGAFSRQGGYDAAKQLLALAERPTALFIASDQQAIGVMHACHEFGVQVPEDLAIVSFDGSWDAGFTWPPLSTVRQPLEEIAPLAVRLVTEAGDSAPRHELRRTHLVIERSCGCP